MFPKGSIVRCMRLQKVETSADGSETVLTVSGPGVIVRIRPEVPGMKPADVRRSFTRAARALKVIPDVVETAHGHYSQTGKPIAEGAPSAYQCFGTPAALAQLVEHFAVAEWHPAVNSRVPFVATGSGPEKPRPASGTAFGRPATAAATAAALAKDRADTLRAERKAGRI